VAPIVAQGGHATYWQTLKAGRAARS
jgi:hypothetical protein